MIDRLSWHGRTASDSKRVVGSAPENLNGWPRDLPLRLPAVARCPLPASPADDMAMHAVRAVPLTRRRLGGLLAVLGLFCLPLAHAQFQGPTGSPGTGSSAAPPHPGGAVTVPPEYLKPLPELPGVVSWNTLGSVKLVREKNRVVPDFPAGVKSLDNTTVKLWGFMLPIQPGEKHTHFLLTVSPQTCSFCLPAGPEGIVEVKSRTPIRFGIEPIVLSGRLAVLRDDPMGVFYRLTDAAPASR